MRLSGEDESRGNKLKKNGSPLASRRGEPLLLVASNKKQWCKHNKHHSYSQHEPRKKFSEGAATGVADGRNSVKAHRPVPGCSESESSRT